MANNRVRGLDGREYTWNLTGYRVALNDTRERSSYHLQCRQLLRELYPTIIICEEVPLPGTSSLRLDFYVPQLKLAVEVQGEQHFQPNRRFHRTQFAFAEAQKRDGDKERWCRINGVRLVSLRYDERGRWRGQIQDTEAENH